MKAIIAIEADLDRGPLGTRSRLADDLAGAPVLRRTVERALRCEHAASVHVVCGADQRERVEPLVRGLHVQVESHAHGLPPWQDRVLHARKWAMDSWRGGIGGLCALDEQLHAGVLGALGQREQAEVVASVPGAAVLIDPALLDEMILHFQQEAHDTRIVFSQAPPGLAAFLASPSFLDDMFRAGFPPGAVITYIPDNPQADFTTKPCCYAVPAVVAENPARVLADTDRAIRLLEALLREADERKWTAESVCRYITRYRDAAVEPLPREVELELTTEDPLAETTLRPRGSRVPSRPPISLELVRRVAEEIARFDDSLLVLGGFGEPLAHPDLPAVLRTCREAGVFGLAVRTNGLALTGAIVDALIETDVDIVNVTLDAGSAETYRALHNTDGYDRVVANIEALHARVAEKRRGPLIVPEMAKLRATLPEQEAFYDGWIRRVGWANIVSPSHYARQLPDQAVMNMAPSGRGPCSRLRSRLLLLADGTAVTCDQDFAAKQPVGDVPSGSVQEIWTGETLETIREAHAAMSLDRLPLCPHCDEWHRP